MRVTYLQQDIFTQAPTTAELQSGWTTSEDDVLARSVSDVIESHIAGMPRDFRGSVPSGQSSGSWAVWVGHLENDLVVHQFISSLSLYAVDEDGLVSFPADYDDLSWASMLRAVANGYYGSLRDPDFVLVAPAPGIGGNGAFTTDLVNWLATNSPEIIVAYVAGATAEELRDRVDIHRDRRARKLADDWAARRIDSPHHLRAWLETKESWQVTEVATRLRLNDAAAHELLASIGFEDTGRGVMTLRISNDAMRSRDRWIGSEIISHEQQMSSLGYDNSDLPIRPEPRGLPDRIRRRLRR